MNKKDLENKYLIENKTTKEIGEEFGLSKSSVLYWLEKYNIKKRPAGRKSPNLINKTFGELLVLDRDKNPNKKNPYWICLCSCGKKTNVETNSLLKGQKTCFECRNKIISNKQWKGLGELSLEKFSSIKRNAESRKISFDLSIEYLWNLYIKQDKKCALTGLEISFSKRRVKSREGTASLDRIDSCFGYIEGNVQWVHKDINGMKWDLSQKQFIQYCKLITEFQKNANSKNAN